MKKHLAVILCLILSLVLFTCAASVSADEITVELNGEKIAFDTNPQIIDGRTMVPLRKIFEELGASVKWDEETKTVAARKNKKTITLSIGSADLQIDKGKTDDEGNPITETVSLEVPAQIVSGRTFVPVRAVSESFGLHVDWDEARKKVIITSEDDEDDSWKENIGSINLTDLTYEGEGIAVVDHQITITKGGDFTLTGTLADGNITILSQEKVKLCLDGAKITSTGNPCIFVEQADKAYITLTRGTQNELIAERSEDGAIYSKDNLEIKGDGEIVIDSRAGHGIKASDNLTIENGTLTIHAASDGIHVNDTFKMTGGTVNITAIGDGIDCESIVNILDGTLHIETNGTPLATAQAASERANGAMSHRMFGETADVEFETSTKGINAEWMLCISGGDIQIHSASHAIHCGDEIEINGGNFTLSSNYDKGISAHGNLTISGADTIIDITQSTEGIESKNVLTLNDGDIRVVASDDALNATGGNSGNPMQGGMFGENMESSNRPMPEDFEPDKGAPNSGPMRENGREMRAQGEKPQRGEAKIGETNRFPAMQPPAGMPQNGEMMPPPEMPQNGEFTPPEIMEEGAVPEGFMGGSQGNRKTCLIINGGNLELCAVNDCLDANGSLAINGGTIKATNSNGSFTGAFAIVDPDGTATVSEQANLVFAAGSGSVKSFGLTQNNITIYCESTHAAGDQITVSDAKGNAVYEYTPSGSYQAVLIASKNIKTGEKYSVTIGDTSYEVKITEQNTVIGTQSAGGMSFGKGQGIR